MNILVKYNLRKVFVVAVTILLVLMAIWLCLVITDYVRYKMNTIPIFAILQVELLDYGDGHEERYKGLGYTYVETMRETDTSNKFYILGVKVK